MAAPAPSAPLARIELDVPNQRLLWGQRTIALTPKAFLLLRTLVERPNELITKDELLAAAWPGVVVEEGQVRQFIGELRRLLSDDAEQPRFIETVRARGYRLIGDIALRGHHRAPQAANSSAAPDSNDAREPGPDQVAGEHAAGIDSALAVHRRAQPVRGAELVERHADREQLADRCDQPRLIRVEVVDDLARAEIHHAQRPRGVAVQRLVEDLPDLGGDRLRRRAVVAAAGCEHQRSGNAAGHRMKVHGPSWCGITSSTHAVASKLRHAVSDDSSVTQ